MRIFFSVGEPSGDQHAAALIQELKQRHPDIVCEGYGGPHMESQGCKILFPLTEYAVMGIMSVLPLLGTFIRVGFRAKKYFQENKYDAVVLVDFPGFNWWIAYFARLAGIRVIYYLPPQLWAWAPWRIGRVKRNVDQVLSGLSFEKDWYESRGVKVEFVGHPFFDEVVKHQLDKQFIEQMRPEGKTIIGILPGSRTMEVVRNFPHQVEVMQRLVKEHPNLNFVVGNYKPAQKEYCINYLRQLGIDHLPISFHTGKTHEVIEGADMLLMVSGSISMEVLARRKPAVVLYCAHWTFQVFGNILITCKYMTLPNLMAGRQLLPEYPFSIFSAYSVNGMTHHLNNWIAHPVELKRVQTEIEQLCEDVAYPGATARAADALLQGMQVKGAQVQPANQKIAA